MEANEEGEDVAKTAGHPLDEQEAAKEPVRDCVQAAAGCECSLMGAGVDTMGEARRAGRRPESAVAPRVAWAGSPEHLRADPRTGSQT